MWRWDQGRLLYFQFDVLRDIAKAFNKYLSGFEVGTNVKFIKERVLAANKDGQIKIFLIFSSCSSHCLTNFEALEGSGVFFF